MHDRKLAVILAERPNWQSRSRPRLAATLVASALLISALLVLVRFTSEDEPLTELEVHLLSPEQELVPEPVVPIVPELIEELPLSALATTDTPLIPDEPPQERDWYAQFDDVVKATVESQQKSYSVNPVFDEKRRQAAVKFAPSKAPQQKPIWENVERDQMGRRILVSGDCYRVVDDPNVTNYEMFREFQQYMVYCTKYKRSAKELPWVNEIRDRHEYMTDRFVKSDGVDTILLAELQ